MSLMPPPIGRPDAFQAFPREALAQSLIARFDHQSSIHAARLAIKSPTATMTYGGLQDAANRVARTVLEVCGDPQNPAVILTACDERLVLASLGVLKAGQICVPLSPQEPERLAPMVEQCGARLIVTDDANSALAHRLSGGRAVVNVDTIADSLPPDPPGVSIASDWPAYILFTSGSTAAPKGVVHTHQSVMHIARDNTNSQFITTGDRVGLISANGFIGSPATMFRALLNGAALLPFDLHHRSMKDLATWLERQGITLLQTVPSVFHSLGTVLLSTAGFPHLRILHLAGEPLTRQTIDLFKRCFGPTATLMNEFGATETGAVSRLFISHAYRSGDTTVAAGYAVEDKIVSLLDPQGEEVSRGQIGEIAVKSRYLAQGYWRRSDITRQAFVPDCADPDFCLYRTGDLGRLRSDGCLEHLGRKDFLLKVGGRQVDAAAIEAALLSRADIVEAAAVGQLDAAGNTVLTAYVVCRTDDILPTSALRRSLRATLHEELVPSRFVQVDALPRTPTGKIDRQALPPLTAERPSQEVPYAVPETRREKQLATLWADVLGVDGIGRHDNFFELGGRSLDAMQIISRVADCFDVDVPVRSLFEAPTIAAFAARVAKAENRRADSAATAIREIAEDGAEGLSFAQRRLWFLEQWHADALATQLPVVVRLKGNLDRMTLKRAMAAIVARHDVLRSSFPCQDGSPRQVVAASVPVILDAVDLEAFSTSDQRRELDCRTRGAARQSMDLAQAPLWRMTLFRLSSDDHVLLWSVHHMLIDGWSVGVFLRELTALYEAFSNGRPSPLDPLPMHYGDFVRWQNHALRGERFRDQRHYWRRQLHGLPVRLDLPTDYPRRAVQPYSGEHFQFHIPDPVLRSLKALSADEGCTLFMALAAAFKILLCRYSESREICVGTIIANRNRLETESLIGCLINNLVLRTSVPEGAGFRDVLHLVKEVTLDAYAHQDLPIEALLEGLRADRPMPRMPLFQVMIVLQDMPLPKRSLPGLEIEIEQRTDVGQTACDLTLWLSEDDEGLNGSIEYNTKLFNKATIERLHGHYQTLLETLTERPDQDVDRLTMLTAVERQQIAVTEVVTGSEAPRALLIQARFEAQAERSPDRTALEMGDCSLTYRTLNRSVNRLARALRRLGVGPETCVGLFVERSVDMIVGVLAIFKAGGAYVPLDQGYPEQRLRHILAETQALVVLTHAHLETRLPDDGCTVVCLDVEDAKGAPADDVNPRHISDAGHLACVLYTSGTTGQPKGIELTHGALGTATRTLCEAFDPGPGDRILQLAALCYSTSLEEIFPSLASGATLVLRDDAMLDSATGFLEACRALGITILDLPTSYWHVLAECLTQNDLTLPSSVRLVIIGGQPARRDRLDDWQRRVDASVRLVNTYGPSEAAAVSTMRDLSGAIRSPARYVPIGRAVGHVETYVLDKHLAAVPIGVAGDLYIGGGGLARGYLGRPGETSNAFIPNPFAPAPGTRLFRTGDRVRNLDDGDLDYLGRVDHQVKIHGVRVELGEIEAALRHHPSIREAVVTVPEDAAGGAWLAAYVVTCVGQTVDNADLDRWLRHKLPDTMIPAVFVNMNALPRTGNNKVDLQALPRPARRKNADQPPFVAPCTSIETLLASLWANLLDVPKVGLHDNFFELGGHSLAAVKLLTDIEAATGRRLPLEMLFEAPTIAALAERLEGGTEGPVPNWSRALPLQPRGERTALFVVSMVAAPVYCLSLIGYLGKDQPVYGLPAKGAGGDRLPDRRIEDMAKHCVAMMRAVQPQGPYCIMGHSAAGLIALEVARILRADDDTVARLVLLDTDLPGSLGINASRMLNQPFRTARFAGSLVGQALGLSQPDQPTTLKAARVAANIRFRPRPFPGDAVLITAAGRDNGAQLVDGWRRLIVGALTTVEAPGDHTSMLQEPNVAALAAVLRKYLGG